MSVKTPWQITAEVMAAERPWLVQIPIKSNNAKNMETNDQIQPVGDLFVRKAQSQRNYWAKMTPEQRGAEMKRRMANRKPREKEGENPPTPRGKAAIASESIPSSITIPAAIGCVVTRNGNLLNIRQEQDFRGAQRQVIDLHIAEAKLVAGALLNLVGKKE